MLHTEEELENILNNFKERILVKNCLECVEKKSFYTDGRVVCCNKIKKHRYSIYKNTCFYHRKVSIITILKIINLFLNNMPYKLIAYIGGLSRNRVTDIIYMFNLVPYRTIILTFLKLGGTCNIIEIDEIKFGRRKYSRGHHVGGVWVFGGVERRTKKDFFIPIEKRNKETLENILEAQVNLYSIIYSDCWKAYNNLKNIFLLIKQLTIVKNL